MTEHAKICSASAAHRWMRCAAAPAMENLVGVDRDSGYAREGTVAHYVLAECLGKKLSPHERFMGRNVDGVLIDAEMCDHVAGVIEHFRVHKPDVLLVEQRVDFSKHTGVEGSFGTADIIALYGTILHVADFKYGRGVTVEAKDNEQARLYALGAFDIVNGLVENISSVVVAIHQPRLGIYDQHEYSVQELLDFAKDVRVKAKRAEQVYKSATLHDDGTVDIEADAFAPSEKACKFCNARHVCPAIANMALKQAIDDFSVIDDSLPAKVQAARSRVKLLDAAAISKIMFCADLIEQWLGDIRVRALDEAMLGRLPDWKLVEGRPGNRKWRDEQAAEAMLTAWGLDATYKQIISPAEAEKLLKKNKLTEFFPQLNEGVVRAAPSLKVVPDSDPRPAVNNLRELEAL